MTGRLLRPGGQGSSGDGDLEDVIAAALAESEVTRPFGWVGSGEDGSWSEKDYENIDTIVADITNLQSRGNLKTDKDIKSYLNEVMEDNGITLAQYQALKLWYGIE